jgi:hypothetical protein
MDSQVNNVDLKQAREFYAQQFKVRLNIYRFNPATGEFMPYGAAPNDLPLRYTAGDGWQFSGESGVMSGDALDGSDTSSGTSPEGGVMRGGGGGGE